MESGGDTEMNQVNPNNEGDDDSMPQSTSVATPKPVHSRGKKKSQSPHTSTTTTPHNSPAKRGAPSPAKQNNAGSSPSKVQKPKCKSPSKKSPSKKSPVKSNKGVKNVPKNTKGCRPGLKRLDTEEKRQTDALQEMVSVVKGVVSGVAAPRGKINDEPPPGPNHHWCMVLEGRIDRIDEEVCMGLIIYKS